MYKTYSGYNHAWLGMAYLSVHQAGSGLMTSTALSGTLPSVCEQYQKLINVVIKHILV